MPREKQKHPKVQYIQLDSRDAAMAFPYNGLYGVKRMRTRAVISVGEAAYIVDYADLHDPLISEIKNDTTFVEAIVDELLHRRTK